MEHTREPLEYYVGLLHRVWLKGTVKSRFLRTSEEWDQFEQYIDQICPVMTYHLPGMEGLYRSIKAPLPSPPPFLSIRITSAMDASTLAMKRPGSVISIPLVAAFPPIFPQARELLVMQALVVISPITLAERKKKI